jgi:hypothetical protein
VGGVPLLMSPSIANDVVWGIPKARVIVALRAQAVRMCSGKRRRLVSLILQTVELDVRQLELQWNLQLRIGTQL